MEISKQEIEAIIRLSPEKRYTYFIKRICDWECIWTLFDDDSIILNEGKNGELYVILFPFNDFASYYINQTKAMSGSICKCFELAEFLNTTIRKLQVHNINKALIFPVPDGFGLNVSISTLIDDINEELENYK